METTAHDKEAIEGDERRDRSPRKRPRYTRAELLAECDPSQPDAADMPEWDMALAAGNELP